MRTHRGPLALLICVFLQLAPGPGRAQGPAGGELPLPGEKEFSECRRIQPDKKVVISLKPESELADLVGWIKAISCRPFVFPASLRQAKVTIVVPEAITAGLAYRIFLSALESMGLTVQPEGRVLKIIESNRAHETSIPVIPPGEEAPATQMFVTRLLKLRHVAPDDIVQVLGHLKGRDGDIIPYAPGNILVITDLARNVRRMEQVVSALDLPLGAERLWWIRLDRVVATEAAQLLQQLFSIDKGGKGGAERPRRPAPAAEGPASAGPADLSLSQLVPDERTNSLFLLASEAAYQRVLSVIRRMEQQGGEIGADGERIHVYPLENAGAEEMAGVLQGFGAAKVGGGGRPTASRPAGGAAPSAGGGAVASVFQEEVKIGADKATNSLIIVAGGKDFQTLRGVIRRLDIPRRQVFVEATVMEITLARDRTLGLSYHAGRDAGNGQGALFGNFGDGQLLSLSAAGAASSLAGLAGLAYLGPAFNLASIGLQGQIPSFGVVLQALQNNGNVNVLQVPNILTTDNEKATIQVGQTLPFPSASFSAFPGATPGSTGIPTGTSVQRQDVALKLDITPHVNDSDVVRLEIDNEISDVDVPDYNHLGPSTNKRALKTMVVVRDQQPVVLGGIIKDRTAESTSSIPFLGDIPVLGALFRTTHKEAQKQMLLIVLTPYIIKDPSDLRRVFEHKMQERREFLESSTAFKDERAFDKVADYSRKRGALEEINRTALEAERDAEQLHAAERGPRRKLDAGPVEVPAPPAAVAR